MCLFNIFKKEQEPNWTLINADLKSRAIEQEKLKETTHYGSVKGVK